MTQPLPILNLEAELAAGAKPVPGFPLYLVRPSGEVISFQKRIPIIMSPRPHRGGYKIVTLCNADRQFTTTVHRLVATVFLPNPNSLPLVRHIDGDGTHNDVSNLLWGTYEDNEADKITIGRRRYGTAKMKLNSGARTEAKKLFASGLSRKELAARFNVNVSTISRLLSGATWENRKWPMAEKAAQR